MHPVRCFVFVSEAEVSPTSANIMVSEGANEDLCVIIIPGLGSPDVLAYDLIITLVTIDDKAGNCCDFGGVQPLCVLHCR